MEQQKKQLSFINVLAWISIVFSGFGIVYASECPDEEYIKYKNISFVHKGFVSLYDIDPKTKKGKCDLRAETYLYNKSSNKNKPILVGDEVVRIKEYGSDIIEKLRIKFFT